MKHYVYRHIRPDKNEPFYIGVGTKPNKNFRSISSEYRRAYSLENRNNYWHNIYNLCNKQIEVEILYESDDRDEINKKETEFIKIHGRSDLGIGSLVNMTNGGDGRDGFIVTDEYRQNCSEGHSGEKHHFWGKKFTEEHRQNMRNNHADYNGIKNPAARPVLQFTKNGEFIKEWDYIKQAAVVLGTHLNCISACCRNKKKSAGGFIWKYK